MNDNGLGDQCRYDNDTSRVVKYGSAGEIVCANQWCTAGPGRNTKQVFAGATRIVSKQEIPAAARPENLQFHHHPDRLTSTSYVTVTVAAPPPSTNSAWLEVIG